MEPQRKRLSRERRSRGASATARDTAENRVRGRKILFPSSPLVFLNCLQIFEFTLKIEKKRQGETLIFVMQKMTGDVEEESENKKPAHDSEITNVNIISDNSCIK